MTTPNYAVFIFTYGRPDNVLTVKTLRNSGYTGKIYYICDTSDKTLDQYKANFGDEVIVFDKKDYKNTFDIMDNQTDDRTVIFARNAAFDIADELGLDYFIPCDDDYNHFNYRFNDSYQYIGSKPIRSLDKVFKSMITYIENSKVDCICFSQGGDFIGGKNNGMAQAVKTKRKAMNLYIHSVKKKYDYVGRLNDDVNTYLKHGRLGRILLTTSQVCLEQAQTQAQAGGLTDIYLAFGTYVKSFYSVVQQPSSVKINMMGNKNRRLHHVIDWNKTVPKIIRQDYKKA